MNEGKGVEQPKIPQEKRKNTGVRGSTSDKCLPGTSASGDSNSSKMHEGTSNAARRSENITQQTPGSKSATGSKRIDNNSPRTSRTVPYSKTDVNKNQKPSNLHKNKYISNYIQSLGDRSTNTGGPKATQKSDNSLDNQK